MQEVIFHRCQDIVNHINSGKVSDARDMTIRLLDEIKQNGIEQDMMVNHIVRMLGLYPYIKGEMFWSDSIAYNSFKTFVSKSTTKTLHFEQSRLLKALINGDDIAVSAPTSFGKSFIVDAYITHKNPQNVVIIVPTIALTDETRRRLCSKFSDTYNIITTSEVELGERNIFIFPQERVFSYLGKIKQIDLLVIDEFYKAEPGLDDRSSILLKAIMELSNIAKQRYYLAPNISELKDNAFTKGMKFEKIDFKTVVTNYHNDYLNFTDKDSKPQKKKERLLEIIKQRPTKNLVYAGSYSQTAEVIQTLIDGLPVSESELLKSFSGWLRSNYCDSYNLSEAVLRGIGIHNGKLHRSLSQIQVKLFEKDNDINTLVSTSSIIEGVNTSAENVILWSNKNGNSGLSSFEYSNIAGRSGRMFKYFVGSIYALEEPPAKAPTQLKLEMPDEVLLSLDAKTHGDSLTREQIIKIVAFQEEVDQKIGAGVYNRMINDNTLKSFSGQDIRSVVSEIIESENSFKSLVLLNSTNTKDWNSPLRDAFFHMKHIDMMDWQFIRFVKILSHNWQLSLPQLFEEFKAKGVPVNIDNFFDLERIVTFDMVSLLGKINTILKYTRKNAPDCSSFITKASHAFLPKLVYELEEYGLPRMMSRKIHVSKLIDLEIEDISVNDVIKTFISVGKDTIKCNVDFCLIENYILDYFYQGITMK